MTMAARDTTSRAPKTGGTLIAWGGVGLLLYVAHTAFIPVALAFLFALILSAPVEALHKRKVPRSVSALLILVLALTSVGGAVALLWTPAQEWSAKAPQTMAVIKQKITPIARIMNHLDELRQNAENMGAQGHNNPPSPAAAGTAESAPSIILDIGGPVVAGLLAFVIVTLFLLTGGPPMLARMTGAFVDNLKSSYVLDIIGKVREEVGRFYLVTTLINIGLGLATALAMWAWGMPSPYLWGAVAAVLNYIPYAGPGTTLAIITLVAAVSFSTLGHILGTAATYVLIALIEGQVAQPLLVGRRMDVNPLLIFLALWFGGLFWGIAGIILATPLLVALKVVAANTDSGHPLMEFLGPNDQTPGRDSTLRRYTGRSAQGSPSKPAR